MYTQCDNRGQSESYGGLVWWRFKINDCLGGEGGGLGEWGVGREVVFAFGLFFKSPSNRKHCLHHSLSEPEDIVNGCRFIRGIRSILLSLFCWDNYWLLLEWIVKKQRQWKGEIRIKRQRQKKGKERESESIANKSGTDVEWFPMTMDKLSRLRIKPSAFL